MPAAAAGLEDGDRIVAINGTPVADFSALGELIQKEAVRIRLRSVSRSSADRSVWISP